MTFVVKSIFQSRATSYFDPNIKSVGVLPSICDTLCKYNLFTYFETWFHNSSFSCYEEWKSIVYREVRNSELKKNWTEYCVSHPNLHLAKACIDTIPPQQFWSLIDQYPDLRRISCHGRNYSQPYFFERNQSSDNRSHGFGAKFLLKKLSASDCSYERKPAFSAPSSCAS